MFESIILAAFFIGLVSAVSLPMGAVTTFFWTPTDRVIAILMAFGGGALLAALTIDLVATAVDSGHFHALAIGAICGGLLFVGLNRIVNDYGGFLRKASTTVYHMRRKQHEWLKKIASHLKRTDLFNVLTTPDLRILAASIHSVDISRGNWIYQSGDPSDNLYIIMSGEVDLINPRDSSDLPERLTSNDVFGWRALITGSPFSYSAYAISDVSLLVLPRHTYEILILNSSEARQKIHQMLRSEDILSYLQDDQRLDKEQAEAWLDEATHSLVSTGVVPPAISVKRHSSVFNTRLEYMQHIPLTQGLSQTALELIGARLIYKQYPKGTIFYHQNDTADRMYIIEQGEVQLLGAVNSKQGLITLRDSDAFGDLSMLTGAKHSVIAVAEADTTVWELRKSDFDDLLLELPELTERVRAYVQRAIAEGYLVHRHHMDETDTLRWMRRAMHNIDAGRPIPAAADIRREISENRAAPLAIWLGITLDGIPESLVIGASMIDHAVELSLIVGLFLSNYPEALSSSIGMRKQGMSKIRIVNMWTSIMLLTGIGAALGSIIFTGASASSHALIQGIAAGAMLTMIAETMLPEAYFKGGSVVGLSTLFGFLVAIFSKTLE